MKKLNHESAAALMVKSKLKPLERYKSSKSPWKCECLKCGKIVFPSHSDVKSQQSGCIYCAGRKVDVVDAVRIMKEAGLKPIEPYRSANLNWKSKCLKCGAIVSPTFGNISRGQGGCGYCAKTIVDPKEAEKRMLFAGLKPLEPYKNNTTKWKCKCLVCGRSVSPTYAVIQRGGGGCQDCANIQRGNKQRFSPERVKKIMLECGYKPLEEYRGGHARWKCECLQCGAVVHPTFQNAFKRDKSKFGCVYCAGMKVDVEKAKLMMLDAGLKPLEKYVGKDFPWKCRCLKCKNVVFPSYGNIKRGQGGCSYCRETGLNYKDPAYFYIIANVNHDALKVGISNTDSKPNRIKSHEKNGWQVHQIYNFKSGKLASDLETSVLRWLRKTKELPVHLSPKHMPQGGHSETVSSVEISAFEIQRYVEKLLKK
jgi:recombinational DNA repair protein (RecF pathway)